MKKTRNKKLNALLNLLQDDDLRVASLAMEQILKLGAVADETIAEFQEDNDPIVRSRMHQLSSILARRRARMEFAQAVKKESISLWDGIIAINQLYDPECGRHVVDNALKQLTDQVSAERCDTPYMASFMKEQEFLVPEEDILDVDLYLVERVLAAKYGAPALLCALAQKVGEKAGWQPTIVLFEGRYCLIDHSYILVDPGDSWHIRKLKNEDKIHPCGRKDIWLGTLSQLMLVSLVEGNLRDLYHFGDMLTSLDNTDLDVLPYPLGSDKL